jgi:toxin ParE1/3/4
MKFDFHPKAEQEFFRAISYYEDIEPGLAEQFSLEVYSTVQNILSYPKAWPVWEGDALRCLVNRFPYGVIYSIEPDRIYIIAVMHLHRHPDYWRDRR